MSRGNNRIRLHLAEGRVNKVLSDPNAPLLATVKRAAVQAVLYSIPHVHLAYVYVLYAAGPGGIV
jgi:hypothetical protein